LVGMSISPASMEIIMAVPQKCKTRTTIWSRSTTPGCAQEEIKVAVQWR
jgi:hypothetical protein